MSKIKNMDFEEVLKFFKDNPEGVLTPGKSEEGCIRSRIRIQVNTYAEVQKDNIEIWTKSQTDLVFILCKEDFMAARLIPVPFGCRLMICFLDGEIMTFWVNDCK